MELQHMKKLLLQMLIIFQVEERENYLKKKEFLIYSDIAKHFSKIQN